MDLLLTLSLLAVAEAGTIGRAATRLGVSQSALSRRLQQLEEDLGARLFERSGRGILLSEAGRLAVSEGALLVERYERMKQSLGALGRLEAGVVRVGGGATAVNSLLPEAMARFRRAYPKIRLRLEEGGSRQIEAAVLDDRLELGIVTLPARSPELTVEPWTTDRIVLVAAPTHPFARRRGIEPSELMNQELIGFEAGSAIRQTIDDALRACGVELNVVMEVRSAAAILRLVDATSSLAFVSELGVRGRRVVRVTGLRVERELALITRRGRVVSEATTRFMDELRTRASSARRGRPRGQKA